MGAAQGLDLPLLLLLEAGEGGQRRGGRGGPAALGEGEQPVHPPRGSPRAGAGAPAAPQPGLPASRMRAAAGGGSTAAPEPTGGATPSAAARTLRHRRAPGRGRGGEGKGAKEGRRGRRLVVPPPAPPSSSQR